jgi:hypothetical protein
MYSEMTRGFGGRLHPRHVRTIHNLSQSKDKTIIIKGNSTTPIQQGCNRTPSDREPQEVEEDEASEGDTTLNQEDYSSYFAERTRDIQQEPAKLRYKHRRK